MNNMQGILNEVLVQDLYLSRFTSYVHINQERNEHLTDGRSLINIILKLIVHSSMYIFMSLFHSESKKLSHV